jgi:hypothetical protein
MKLLVTTLRYTRLFVLAFVLFLMAIFAGGATVDVLGQKGIPENVAIASFMCVWLPVELLCWWGVSQFDLE